ncbi:MAG: hypothetical protein FJ135_06985 [Deltaproteobacteria bacterium]|nr:hypothetical protein [Deltaproteobacteria bacterium]
MPEVARLDLGGGILVPIKAVVEIARFLKENAKEATVLVGVKDKALHLLARWSGEHFSVRLVEKRFPDYRRIIPQQQHEHGFIFNRQELAGALKRLSLLSNERFKGVVFDLELSHAFLSHENPEVGQGKEAVQAVFHADQPLKLGFNARYVLDALDAIKGDEVAMDVMGPGRPVRFWGDDGNSFFLVMPMTL